MKEIKLENIIIGRVEPHIYAFTTGTVPNYLKVGDTYRPVSLRLMEWKEHFPDLEKKYEEIAKVSDNVYFRDYAVHQYLENDKNLIRLSKESLPSGVYYSKEFFNNATEQDVAEAINDINVDYENNNGKYQFYNVETQLPETFTYERIDSYEPRPNQKKTIEKFKNAIAKGRTNLLMYAVMRFGKSFTSMCCAVEMKARIVVIASAKADVKNEWKKTVESHIKFSDYFFLDSDALLRNENAIKEVLKQGKNVAIFLTLQDLQGELIKEKHKEVFNNDIDLLIVDETHFGARAEKYGQVLKELGKAEAKATTNKKDSDDFIEADEANTQINKVLKAKIKLHLSGTPYRILMSSEFTQDDIIAFYQFSDIVKDQETWDKENILSDDIREWDNPYYGFPQMVRFAFNPNESSRKRLEELKEKGISYAFSALLRPKSIVIDDENKYKKFLYEEEITDLLEVIDGSKEDEGLLGFLDYDKIKEGNMCRHIVMVLPYCASCDAMEELIHKNADKFKNLSKYKIINISGLSIKNEFGDTQKIKNYIHKCEEKGVKTLTLTVNRMLTGSTVEEWDTMIYLKDTASPQEYDQAIFRLQNQYIKKYVDDEGNEIKYNMKPQTLLVDFDPNRMFAMQEQKAQIYNVNVDEAGNSKLEDRLREELRISPIVTMNSDKIEQVEATDIISAVSEYSKNRGVAEETLEIPVDLSLLDIDLIYKTISNENELGSKEGLTIKANQSDGQEMSLDYNEDEPQNENNIPVTETTNTQASDDNKHDPVKQFRSYYARILFFAFLTKNTIISLEDIISIIDTEYNARIAKNIGISKKVLECIQNNINKFILRDLDYKIYNLNRLSNDTTIDPIERANVAIKKFGRLGVSEIITPQNICDDMVNLIPDDCYINAIDNGNKILDIAGKAGEFALAIYQKYISLGYDVQQIKNTIYTIPTSSITYEFNRMVYEVLELNIDNIALKFNSYDLLNIKCPDGKIDFEKINSILKQSKPFNKITINGNLTDKGGDEKVKFDAIVGNPPYQAAAQGTSSSDDPIYHLFVDISYVLSKKVALITPARFLFNAGKTPSSWNQKMLNDNHIRVAFYENDSNNIFNDIAIPGGIAITYRDENQNFGAIRQFINYSELNSIKTKVWSMATESIRDIIYTQNKFNLTQLYNDYPEYKEIIGSKGKDKRFRQIIMERLNVFTKEKTEQNDLRILGLINKNRSYRFIKRKYVEQEAWIDKYKVFVPFSNGASGTIGDKPARMISKPVIGYPGDGMTQTFIGFGYFDTEEECIALYKYIKTKFCRALLGILKVTQGNKSETWEYVPIQNFSSFSDIDWSKSISEIDNQLYVKYGLNDEEILFIEKRIDVLD